MPALPQRFPIQTIATFHRFPLGIARAMLFAIGPNKTPWPLLAPLFLERPKLKNFGQFLNTITQDLVSFAFLGAVGCRILRHSAAILRRPVPHVGFCLEKSDCLPEKKTQKGRFWQNTLREYSGFLRQFCGKFSKVKIHLPMVRIAFFSVLSAHPRSCRPFPP